MEPSCSTHEIVHTYILGIPGLRGRGNVEQQQEVAKWNHEVPKKLVDKCASDGEAHTTDLKIDDLGSLEERCQAGDLILPKRYDSVCSKEEFEECMAAMAAARHARLRPPARRVPPLHFTDDDGDLSDSSDDDYYIYNWRNNAPLEELRSWNILYHDYDGKSDKSKEAERYVYEQSDDDDIYGPDSSEEYKRGEKRREYCIHFMDGKAHGLRCKKVLEEAGCSVLKYCPIRPNSAFVARLAFQQAKKIAGGYPIRPSSLKP